jgi:integrase
MKGGRPHRVPLSNAALAILRACLPAGGKPDRGALIFAGARPERPLSLTALSKALRIAMRGVTAEHATVHGLRSTFADWCAERGEPAELRELALAHAPAHGNSDVILAYRRSDLLDRRRPLMQRWAAFACGETTARRHRSQ